MEEKEDVDRTTDNLQGTTTRNPAGFSTPKRGVPKVRPVITITQRQAERVAEASRLAEEEKETGTIETTDLQVKAEDTEKDRPPTRAGLVPQ